MNLLPEEEKNNIRHEYVVRFYTMAVYFLAVVFLIGIVAIFPYYFSGRLELERITDKVVLSLLDDPEGGGSIQLAISEFSEFSARLKLLSFDPKEDFFRPSSILTAVLGEKPENISITSFFYIVQDGDEISRKVLVSGEAGDRDSLLLFTKNLSVVKNFSEVDLPVSNFSKKTDIDFTVNIILAEKEDEEGEQN